MPLPNYLKRAFGSEISWKSSGGTYTITLTSLANNGGREGGKADLGNGDVDWDQDWVVFIESAVNVTAVNGAEIELWWGNSLHATAGNDNPGNLTGVDAALSNPDELKMQLDFIGSLVLSNARGTNVQKQMHIFRPKGRYGIPLIVNKAGQALSSTAGNHAIRMIPLYLFIQDAP